MYLQALHDTPAVSVHYDCSNEWLFADWRGELTLADVQAGCLTIAQGFLQRPCTRILNNNEAVTRLSEDVPPWLAQEYLPYLSQAGIEYLAWVCPTPLLAQHLVEPTARPPHVLQLALFDKLADGYAWLRDSHFHHLEDPSLPSPNEQRRQLAQRVAAHSAALAQPQHPVPPVPGWPQGCLVAPARFPGS